jgi:hypothetical protein
MTTKKINELMATVKSYASENITIDYLDTIANFARIGIIIHDKNDAKAQELKAMLMAVAPSADTYNSNRSEWFYNFKNTTRAKGWNIEVGIVYERKR